MKLEPIVSDPEHNLLRQQDAFDLFQSDYNQNRPHQSLDMSCPAQKYKPSSRVYNGPIDADYSNCEIITGVSRCGSVTIDRTRYFIGEALASQLLGIKEEGEDIYNLRFYNLDLGYIDKHEGVFHRSDV